MRYGLRAPPLRPYAPLPMDRCWQVVVEDELWRKTVSGVSELIASALVDPRAALRQATATLKEEVGRAFGAMGGLYDKHVVQPNAARVADSEQQESQARERRAELEEAVKLHERVGSLGRAVAERSRLETQAELRGKKVSKEEKRARERLVKEAAEVRDKLAANKMWKAHLGKTDADAIPQAVEAVRRAMAAEIDAAVARRILLKAVVGAKEKDLAAAREALREWRQPTARPDWLAYLDLWASDVGGAVLPHAGAKTGELRRQMELLPRCFHGEFIGLVREALVARDAADSATPMRAHSDLSEASVSGLDRFAAVYLRRMGETLEQIAFACTTGKCSDCGICQDVCIAPGSAGLRGGGVGMQALCLWRFGVCGASQAACWADAKSRPPRRMMAMHEIALQPLPAFMWLGLEEDANASAVTNAFRQLSRVHHPDRTGGSVTMWEVTKECHSLLRDPEKLEAYLLGRNHDEFVRAQAQWGAELSVKQRVARMQSAIVDAQAEQRGQAAKRAQTGKTAGAAAQKIWGTERGAGAAGDAVRQARKAETRALQDLDALVPQMPSVTIRECESLRGRATLALEWPKKLSQRILLDEGGKYTLQYQKQCGPKCTAWEVIYTGRLTSITHTVTDTDKAYVSE